MSLRVNFAQKSQLTGSCTSTNPNNTRVNFYEHLLNSECFRLWVEEEVFIMSWWNWTYHVNYLLHIGNIQRLKNYYQFQPFEEVEIFGSVGHQIITLLLMEREDYLR